MEKRKRIELPEAIIQHIQSFLDTKEAARTALLSTSWYSAWITRPILDFDQKLFPDDDDSFWKLVNNTVERYEQLNLNIVSLKLWIRTEHSLANELIIKALKSGATDLDFKIYNISREFVLSGQVLGFENLTRLCVSGCRIADGMVSCCTLKSLNLARVFAQGTIIWDVICSCPLIENLSLSVAPYMLPFFNFGKQDIDGPILVNEFHKLKKLFLHKARVDPSYFDDFSSKFPCLEDLTLSYCDCASDVQISSPSLERIKFTRCQNIHSVKFDVQKIRKFAFVGLNIPLLSIKTSTSDWEWESHIYIDCRSVPNATWFLELNRLLKKLRNSQISLHLHIWSEKPTGQGGEFQGVCCKPDVGYLTINGPYVAFPEFYYSLFKCCRPMFIECWIDNRVREEVDDEWEKKVLQVCLDSCIAYQKERMSSAGECDLEKVEVHFYDGFVPVPILVPIPTRYWRTSTSLPTVDGKPILLCLDWACS